MCTYIGISIRNICLSLSIFLLGVLVVSPRAAPPTVYNSALKFITHLLKPSPVKYLYCRWVSSALVQLNWSSPSTT